MLIEFELQQIKLIVMMERTLRITDYCVNCISKLLKIKVDPAGAPKNLQRHEVYSKPMQLGESLYYSIAPAD